MFFATSSLEDPCGFLLEDDDIVAFKDVHPVAPIHALVIPRRHVAGVGEVALGDTMLLGRIIVERARSQPSWVCRKRDTGS